MGLMDQFKAKAEELVEKTKEAFNEMARPPQQEAERTKETPKEGGQASGPSERETEGP